MDSAAITVTLGGLAMSAFVLWYFFLATCLALTAVSSSGGVQEVAVAV